MSSDTNWWQQLGDRFRGYTSTEAASEWLDRNYSRVRELFRNVRIRDVVFEPIKDVFNAVGDTPEDRIRSVITQVAVSNAVLAGLPGRMGIGVVVCMGLEGWMALTIAREVGLKIERVSDIWAYFGLLAGIGVTILSVFRVLLGLAFSMFSIIPGLNPMIPAELFVTDLVGVLFWVSFEAARDSGTFSVPSSAIKRIWDHARELFRYQMGLARDGFSPQKVRGMARRLWAWLRGEVPVDDAHARGEIMATACMAWLLAGRFDGLTGPMGQIFIQAIRDRYPDLAHSSIQEIADHMSHYDPSQLEGVVSLIKGRMFELYEIQQINAHHDGVTAYSEADMNHPGDDLILVDDHTGKEVFVQLKATDSHTYVETALNRYPNIPIMTTDEVSKYFAHGEHVTSAGITNAKLETVTHQNFEMLVGGLTPVSAAEVTSGGVAARATVRLWPFVVAYLRKRISQDQLEQAFKRVLGDSGVSFASRMAYSLAFDAVFAWYLLARGTIKIVQAGQHSALESAQPA